MALARDDDQLAVFLPVVGLGRAFALIPATKEINQRPGPVVTPTRELEKPWHGHIHQLRNLGLERELPPGGRILSCGRK